MLITLQYCRLMSRYNAWMNDRLYASCAHLPESALYRDRNAYFGSIYRTLNHVVCADLAFLSRVTGEPGNPPGLNADLVDGFEALRDERRRLDLRLLDWAGGLAEQWLEGMLRYRSQVDGQWRTQARDLMVAHLFNHQAHHRGQVTTLLSQAGLDVGTTDLLDTPDH